MGNKFLMSKQEFLNLLEEQERVNGELQKALLEAGEYGSIAIASPSPSHSQNEIMRLSIKQAEIAEKILNAEIVENTVEDIIEFHVRFEKIHPFQDGNGRVGRMIMFRECLHHDIMPFFIEYRNKEFYIRGIRKYQTNDEKGYLIDTCLYSQDNYEKMVNYFLEDNES